MTTENLSTDDTVFLEQCEEEFKDRYTEKDEEYMKIFNAEPPSPPIIENWWPRQNLGRRNDRRNNRRWHSFDRSNSRGRGQQEHGYHDRNHPRGYQDRSYEEQGYRDGGYLNREYRGRGDYYSKRGRHH